MQTVTSISENLIELLKKQEFIKAYEELFSQEAESIDPLYSASASLKGLTGLIEREKDFLMRAKINKVDVSEPIHYGAYFTFKLSMNFSIEGNAHNLEELCVYKVSQGKIISQQFFIG